MNGETRVLVTGATGFIASALLRRLAQIGVRTFGTVREIGPTLQQRELPPEVEIIETGRYRSPTLARAWPRFAPTWSSISLLTASRSTTATPKT